MAERGERGHMGWSAGDVAAATGGRLCGGGPDAWVAGVSTDSRRIAPGELFWALKGPRFDGHEFVGEALRRGAAGAVVQQDACGAHPGPLPGGASRNVIIRVADTLRALGDFAAWHRRRIGLRVFGVTGSCGKTTTKDLVAAVLGRRWPTVATRGNFNNLIGLPLTLLGARPEDRWAVLEMGMNQPGEIRRLCEIAGPEAGLVTTVQPVHLEGLGDIEGVAAEKAALFAALPASGVAVVNLDDPRVRAAAEGLACRRVTWSLAGAAGAEARCRRWEPRKDGTLAVFDLAGTVLECRLRLVGVVNVANALAAAAAGLAVGVPAAEIRAALEAAAPAPGRLRLAPLPGGRRLLDDTYNANPASMRAALETLARWAGDRPRVAILGTMFELGAEAAAYHEALGAAAAAAGLSHLVAVGEFADRVARGAGGMPCTALESTEALLEWLPAHAAGLCPEGGFVLVKGSRGMGLE
ncbi:UDP-N-acetylmuramoyl-tripeptide--D-alanyl-D-alanine ligase, partial [Dissulfurirhabdus thermomarina]